MALSSRRSRSSNFVALARSSRLIISCTWSRVGHPHVEPLVVVAVGHFGDALDVFVIQNAVDNERFEVRGDEARQTTRTDPRVVLVDTEGVHRLVGCMHPDTLPT